MKILLINSLYPPDVIGGAELSVQYLAESLVESGHDVDVITVGRTNSVEERRGVRVHRIKLKNLYWPNEKRHATPLRIIWNLLDIANPFMASAIKKILEDRKPDVLHTNNLQGISPLVWKLASDMGIPVVHTIRDLYLLCARSSMFRHGANCNRQCFSCRLFSEPKREFSRYVNCVVGISQFILDRHSDLGWFPNASQNVIYNSFPAPAELPAPASNGAVRFGFLGRVDSRKGTELLLSAFENPEIASQATLLVAGTGDPDYVTSLIRKYETAPVTFAGRMTQEDFFGRIDVLVVPSIIHEALGRVILEAYAYGRPVIASNRGGIPEIVIPGKTGFLFDPAQPDELSACLRKFSTDRELAGQIAPACRSHFVQFRSEVIVPKYLTLYQSVVNGMQASESHTEESTAVRYWQGV